MPYITQIINKYVCDRCENEFKLSGEIIQNLNYNIGFYGRDSGGGDVKGICFCETCTSLFQRWMRDGKPDTTTKPAPKEG
jgi:hypothetical protein